MKYGAELRVRTRVKCGLTLQDSAESRCRNSNMRCCNERRNKYRMCRTYRCLVGGREDMQRKGRAKTTRMRMMMVVVESPAINLLGWSRKLVSFRHLFTATQGNVSLIINYLSCSQTPCPTHLYISCLYQRLVVLNNTRHSYILLPLQCLLGKFSIYIYIYTTSFALERDKVSNAVSTNDQGLLFYGGIHCHWKVWGHPDSFMPLINSCKVNATQHSNRGNGLWTPYVDIPFQQWKKKKKERKICLSKIQCDPKLFSGNCRYVTCLNALWDTLSAH